MPQIAMPLPSVILQASGFFLALVLIGFVYGHESVIAYLHKHAADFDSSVPPWKQQESYKRAKIAAREYFPLYWYWGNVRVAAGLFVLMALIDLEQSSLSCGTIAALTVALANQLFYMTCKEPRWQKPKPPDPSGDG